jgi:16S rRNA (cytosine1402-N4)-methyltransferase
MVLMKVSASAIDFSISSINLPVSASIVVTSLWSEATAWALRLCFKNNTWSRNAESTGSILLSAFFIALINSVYLARARLLGLDKDPEALAEAESRLAVFKDQIVVKRSDFRDLPRALEGFLPADCPGLDGILLDLGVSSLQLDKAERGFSFSKDGPLDMRMDPDTGYSAAEWLARTDEQEICRVFKEYGEIRPVRSFVKKLMSRGPYLSTQALADQIARLRGGRNKRSHQHPATLVFQAIRVAVNDELSALEKVLPAAVAALRPGGRVAVIAFQSLEDRIVKEFVRQESRDCLCPLDFPECRCGHKALVRAVNRKPLTPGSEELEQNPRSRSARLRVIEKL